MRRKRVAAGGKAESWCSRRPHLPGWAAAVRRYQSLCQNTLTVPSWLPFSEAEIGLDMTNGSFLQKDWCPLACASTVLFSVWYVGCCPWIMNFSSSSNMETNEVFPSLVLLKLLTEHSIKLLIFASFHFSDFEALFQNVPWHQDLISASSSLVLYRTLQKGIYLYFRYTESIFIQSIIGADWHGEGHFSALLLPGVDYV